MPNRCTACRATLPDAPQILTEARAVVRQILGVVEESRGQDPTRAAWIGLEYVDTLIEDAHTALALAPFCTRRCRDLYAQRFPRTRGAA